MAAVPVMSLGCEGFLMIGARFRRSSCTVPLAAKSGAFTSVVTCPRTFPASDCTARSSARLSAGPDALTSNFGWRRVLRRSREHAADFRQRDAAGRRHLQHRRLQVLFDDAIDRQAALGRPDRHLLDVEVVVAHRQLAGELGQRQLRRRRLDTEAVDDDRVVHRLVGERRLEVEIVDLLRQAIAVGAGGIGNRQAAVGDLDGLERDRPARAFAVRLLLLPLHQLREVPALAVAFELRTPARPA